MLLNTFEFEKRLTKMSQLLSCKPTNILTSQWMNYNTNMKKKCWKRLAKMNKFYDIFFFQRDAIHKTLYYSLILKWTFVWIWSSFLLSFFLSLFLLFIYDLIAYILFCSCPGSLCECLMMHANTNKTMKILEHWCWTQRVESSLDLTDFFLATRERERETHFYLQVSKIHT